MAMQSWQEGFSVRVRGRAQVAHSFSGEEFGTAQALHGITFTVDAVLSGPALLPHLNFLIDLTDAEAALREALAPYDRRNLDEMEEFAGQNTTCERFALAVWQRCAAALPPPPALTMLKIVVRESDLAFVEYERGLEAGAPPGLYTVAVRGRFMAARSLRGERFGASQRLHGATFIVDAHFHGRKLDASKGFLIDICLVERLLAESTAALHQTNLDQSLGGVNPTAVAVADAIGERLARGVAAEPLESLRLAVTEHFRPAGSRAAGEQLHTVVARGRCMIAHSFKGASFGAAQALHGCTYVVDARLSAPRVASDGGFPRERRELEAALALALGAYDRRNLDECAEFGGANTTCEMVARGVWARLAAALPAAAEGAAGGEVLSLSIRESDVACVAFQRALRPPAAAGTVLLVDLDAIEPAGQPEEAVASSPTGIVHRTPVERLAAVIPHAMYAISAEADGRAALVRLGLASLPPSRCLFGAATTSPAFWAQLPLTIGADAACLALVGGSDDVRAAAAAGGVRAPSPPLSADFPLDRALLAVVQCASSPRGAAHAARVEYLRAKRPADQAAYSAAVLDRLKEQLLPRLTPPRELRVLDLGAGILSMLAQVESLADAIGCAVVTYEAVDSDEALLAAAAAQLAERGFELSAAEEAAVTRATGASAAGAALHLTLRVADVLSLADQPAAPRDLVVASAFADLFPPPQLAALLARLAPGALAYLPITFDGVTRLEPPHNGVGSVPSDERVMAAYHEHLEAQGQYLHPSDFVRAVEAAGGAMLATGLSRLKLPPEAPLYPYMLDFVSTGTAVALWADGWDPAAWRELAIARRARFIVDNVDILLRLPEAVQPAGDSYQALELRAPRSVGFVLRTPPPLLDADTVEVRSIVSMISGGTELLMYRGDFDVSDEPLDKTIGGLKDAGLAYPMSYGYALVGTVTAAGAHVPMGWLGKRVFTFAPHAEAAYTRFPSLLEWCSPADAAFLPSAETALSIAHDAHPRTGEVVYVFGAGVIGLLVIAALQGSAAVTAVDPVASRRDLALRLGAAAAVSPEQLRRRAADVSIECSGNPAALQAALDGTRDAGTVVLASWYGRKAVTLALGTRFHRSHLKIIASQVSEVVGEHAARWSKARRFEAAWALIERVRPSEKLPLTTLPFPNAAEAYDLLDRGVATIAQLRYGEEAQPHRSRF
ncbi:hypothetical protein AB1Y20_017659 [Prymnesium parvum]|uniref:6-pyruvoyltetrahydropterin synthase n=1 Tax=Prymnesium parvum TaxID=97485 RepID=A0AB34JL75_PRYPA